MVKFFAGLGFLIMILSGGCSLLFLVNMDGVYVTYGVVAIIGGVPFAAGLAIFLSAKSALKKK